MQRKRRILVVDDERTATHMLVSFLERTGLYEVRAVNDARRAVAAALDFEPDLVITDIVMPGMDGAQFLSALRKEPRFADIPAVILTGLVTEGEIQAQQAEAGAAPIMAKPVRPEALLEIVAAQLGD